MSKQLFANEEVMTQYLTALLCEDEPNDKLVPVAKLLEQVSINTEIEAHSDVTKEAPLSINVDEKLEVTPEIDDKYLQTSDVDVSTDKEIEDEKVVNVTTASAETTPPAKIDKEDDYLNGEFQALFFEVAGLTLAVPLKSLGGIHQLGEINHLFGKPKWFKGVMLNRDEKLSVIDTARWVMPEKYNEKLEASLDYQYLITLGDSQWGLLAEKLINNITLTKEDVKWSSGNSKRPWLAGVIKNKMCALINVDHLTTLLEKGLDSRQ